jgi:hypothetical protein
MHQEVLHLVCAWFLGVNESQNCVCQWYKYMAHSENSYKFSSRAWMFRVGNYALRISKLCLQGSLCGFKRAAGSVSSHTDG